MMLFIHRQYRASAEQLAVRPNAVIPPPRREERVIVPIPGINRAVVQAVNVGRSIAPDVRAVLISDEPEEAAEIRERWERQLPDVPLVIVESPYRALVGPLLAYLHVLDEAWPEDKEYPITFVVIPEYVARSWWERILYNQSANRLRRALIGRPHTVVVSVPYRREEELAREAGRRASAPAVTAAAVSRCTLRPNARSKSAQPFRRPCSASTADQPTSSSSTSAASLRSGQTPSSWQSTSSRSTGATSCPRR